MNYQRFIALGDSMTEGMTDEVINGKFRGWDDRVADVLAKDNPDFSYVNLAVRGKLIGQVAREQVPAALNLIEGKSTLVSFHAGANDVIRPNYDPEKVIAEYTATAKRIATGGGTLMLFCVLENTGEATRSAKIWQKRFEIFNANTRKVATELGAILLDPNRDQFWKDRRFISDDRLHMNAEGHYRAAQGVLFSLGKVVDVNWRKPLPPVKTDLLAIRIFKNFKWFITFGIPWMSRRIRGRSSGDGRSPKYPTPTKWPI